MHRYQFCHNDLKWRNVLVSGDESTPKITLIDCPSGRFWWKPFFEYRRIKDLACLDKVAKNLLRRSQRLKFYCHYQGVDKLSGFDKPIVRRVVLFFKGRD
jgi:tRNA A-37 threonylcarbamoyl transferase component Bud32